MNIATIITCFNRKEKTLRCLRSLFMAIDEYNAGKEESMQINNFVFLTDDGCTDGTADAIMTEYKERNIDITHGTGKCYWAGGMGLAWRKALKKENKWDFFLLLNDDTYVNESCFDILLETHRYCLSSFNRPGIYSGITCDTVDSSKITYGGYVWTNYFLGHDLLLTPTGIPQLCDKANCNIMLVDASVTKEIGIFWDGYQHSCADYDYSMTARRHKIPVLVTSELCGECEYDHHSEEGIKQKILGMTFSQRKEYFSHPLHSSKDVLRLKRRNTPLRYPIGVIGSFLNLYCPKLYYLLSGIRSFSYFKKKHE